MRSTFSSLARPFASRVAPDNTLPWLAIVWTILLTANVFRGLRFPHPFAKGHWLFSFRHGFVKRGLPGTLVEPWLREKTAAEINTVLDTLGIVLLALAFGLSLRWSYRLLARTPMTPAWWGVVAGTTVFVLSPFVVSEANLCGYFDHLLVLATWGGLALIDRDRLLSAGLLGAACMSSHEMFVLFGLPVWCLALWLRRADARDDAEVRANLVDSLRRESLAWARLLAPSLAVVVAISAAERSGAFSAPGEVLFAEAKALHVISEGWLVTSFHPLRVTVAENMGNQGPQFLSWLTSDDALYGIHPTTLVLLLLGLWVLWVRRHGRGAWLWVEAALLAGVVLVPNVIAAIGWDWQRFMMLCHFHGFAALLVLLMARAVPPEGTHPRATLGLPAWGFALLLVGLTGVAVTSSLAREVYFTAPGNGPDRAFRLLTWRAYECDRPLFPNSDFANGTFENWKVKGDAFAGQPLRSDTGAARGAPVAPVGAWVGSYEGARPLAPGTRANKGKRRGLTYAERPPSDRYKGRLRSQPFVIEGDTLVFRVGGGRNKQNLYVRLLVDGDEKRRATGRHEERLLTRRWDVREFQGRQAVIEIADRSAEPWGHINAEGFCYED